MFDIVVNSLLVVSVVVFLVAEFRQWGVPEHLKNMPLTDLEDET